MSVNRSVLSKNSGYSNRSSAKEENSESEDKANNTTLNAQKKGLNSNEENKLTNFMKINYYISNKNIKQADEKPKKIEKIEDEEVKDDKDKLIEQIRLLEKQKLNYCPLFFYNNEQVQMKEEKKTSRKKKKKQNISIQSMILLAKANNVTGAEEKSFTFIKNGNQKDLDEHLEMDF